MRDFIPRRDDGLRQWSICFDQQINFSPEAFSITPEQAAQYHQLHLAFLQSFALSAGASTRTPAGIIKKDQDRRALVDLGRELCGIIRNSPKTTAQQRSALGLSLRRPGRPRGSHNQSHAPDCAPNIQILARSGQRVKIKLTDPAAPMSSAWPAGIDLVVIYTFIGPEAPQQLAGWKAQELTSHMRIELNFPSELAPGTPVWICAQWWRRNMPGPASAAVQTWLAGGEAALPEPIRQAA